MAGKSKKMVKKSSPSPKPTPAKPKKPTAAENIKKYQNRSKVQKDIDSAWEVLGEPGNLKGRKKAEKFLTSYGYNVKQSLKTGKTIKNFR